MDRHPPGRTGSRVGSTGVITAVLALAIVAGVGGPASAQSTDKDGFYVPELRSADRKIVGAGFGLGAFDSSCPGCGITGGIAFELYGGWQVHPRVALLADMFATLHLLPVDGENPGLAGYTALTAAAQVWILPSLYLRAGLGAGSFFIASRRDDLFDPGPGVVLTFGSEQGHKPESGIDISIRLSSAYLFSESIDDTFFFSVAALVGYHSN